MKSPLKSPITNNKCIATLKKKIPSGSVVHSFLYFDGNIETSLCDSKRFVIAHTSKYVNYEFWQCLLTDPERLCAIVEHFYPIESDNIFDILQKEWVKYPDPFVRSAIFFLLNQSSDSGFVSMGKLLTELNLSFNINKLRNFSCDNLHVQLDEEQNFINVIKNLNTQCDYVFAPIGNFKLNFLDDGKSLGFEQTAVNNHQIKDLLSQTNKKIILLYNYSNSVIDFYDKYNKCIIDKWGRETESTKFAKEVLIANF
ncbi:MAG: hypothetical protein VXW16_03945 [Bacteroidota bacterium]|nr:hypothetical protein [Bacteroidota bacterium]